MDSPKTTASQELRLRLFEAHRGSLERLIRSAVQSADDVEDLLQDVALIVLCHDRVPVDERAFGSWCRAVARHLVMHHFRGARRRREVLLEVDEPVFEKLKDTRPSAERLLALRQLLASASGSLDESARELLTQRYVDGETSSEISSRRDETPAGVRVKLYRLRTQLRKRLTQLDSFSDITGAGSTEAEREELPGDLEIPPSTTRPTSQSDLEPESLETLEQLAPHRGRR